MSRHYNPRIQMAKKPIPNEIKVLKARLKKLHALVNSEQQQLGRYPSSFTLAYRTLALQGALIEIECVEEAIKYVDEHGAATHPRKLVTQLCSKARELFRTAAFANLACQLEIKAIASIYELVYPEKDSNESAPIEAAGTFKSVVVNMLLPNRAKSSATVEILLSGKIICVCTDWFDEGNDDRMDENGNVFPNRFEDEYGFRRNSIDEIDFECIEDEMINGSYKLGHVGDDFLLQPTVQKYELRTSPLSRLYDLGFGESTLKGLDAIKPS